MNLRRVTLALAILAVALCLSVPRAQAICDPEVENACGETQQCINYHCVDCVPSGGTDDVLYETDCCSGQAVPGSTSCANPADWGTTWESCTQICA
jgi:hypothetical protein